jgi:hypothetical protein
MGPQQQAQVLSTLTNSQQVLDAVQSSGIGNVAWAYMTGTVGQDALLSGGGGLTSYGQEVQAYIKSAAN